MINFQKLLENKTLKAAWPSIAISIPLIILLFAHSETFFGIPSSRIFECLFAILLGYAGFNARKNYSLAGSKAAGAGMLAAAIISVIAAIMLILYNIGTQVAMDFYFFIVLMQDLVVVFFIGLFCGWIGAYIAAKFSSSKDKTATANG